MLKFLPILFLVFLSYVVLDGEAACPASCPAMFSIDSSTSRCCGPGTELGCGECDSSSCSGNRLSSCAGTAPCAVTGCNYGYANPSCISGFCWGIIGGSKFVVSILDSMVNFVIS